MQAVFVLGSVIVLLIHLVKDLQRGRDHGQHVQADLTVIMATWSVPAAMAMQAGWQILRYVCTFPVVACCAALLILTLMDAVRRRRASSENTQ